MHQRMSTLVIGLGNPILGDDGVGIYAARLLKHVLPPHAAVDVLEMAVGGLELMEAMIGYRRVILLDALWTPNGQVGQVVEFHAGHLPETMHSTSAHDADLPTALRVGRQLGAHLPADEDIHIIAVKARRVLTFSQMLTPAIAEAIPKVVQRVLDLLGYAPTVDPCNLSLALVGGWDDLT